MAMGSHVSIITLNINGLNAPTKRQRLAEWIQKQDPSICCLQETHLKTRDTYRLKVKGWEKIFHANRGQKKSGVAILISDKIDFRTKAAKRDTEGSPLPLRKSVFAKRVYKPEPKTIKSMVTGSYLSIITLNVNGLNAPTKGKDWLNGCKNKIPIYAAYKRPTSKQGTHTD